MLSLPCSCCKPDVATDMTTTLLWSALKKVNDTQDHMSMGVIAVAEQPPGVSGRVCHRGGGRACVRPGRLGLQGAHRRDQFPCGYLCIRDAPVCELDTGLPGFQLPQSTLSQCEDGCLMQQAPSLTCRSKKRLALNGSHVTGGIGSYKILFPIATKVQD